VIEELAETPHATMVASLFDEQGGRMVGHARTRLLSWGIPASWADAEDVVQTACVKVLAAPRPIRHVRAYLYRVIEREADLAAKRYCAAHRDEGGDELSVAEPVAQQSDVCDAVAERTDLLKALRALPRQQRTAVLYSKVMGLTQAETAQAMGKNAGTVATHVSRALTALKVSLGAVCIVLVGVTAAWLGAVRRAADPAAGGEGPSAAAGLLGAWVVVLAGAVLLLGAAWAFVRYPFWSLVVLSAKGLASSVLRCVSAVTSRWRERGGPKRRGSTGSERPAAADRLTARLRQEATDRIAEQRRLDRVNGVAPMSPEDEREYARVVIAQLLEDHARAEIAAGRMPLDATTEERYGAAVHTALFASSTRT
jgi:RNA polymerase sigma-70 factor (ECF subfamily)